MGIFYKTKLSKGYISIRDEYNSLAWDFNNSSGVYISHLKYKAVNVFDLEGEILWWK